MLTVDLRQLERKRRLWIDAALPPEDAVWTRTGIRLAGPFTVRLEVQLAGRDVVVRGTLEGDVDLNCRRCLVELSGHVEEDVAWVFRPGLTRLQAEDQEVYPLPDRGDELDLSDAIREQVILSVPQYAMCSETCRGLCAQCGANLNQTQCDCDVAEADPRWAGLRRLQTE